MRPWWWVVDSAEVVRNAIKDKLPLDQLIETECVCGDTVFLAAPALVEIESVLGMPAAVCCDCCYQLGWEPAGDFRERMRWLADLMSEGKTSLEGGINNAENCLAPHYERGMPRLRMLLLACRHTSRLRRLYRHWPGIGTL
jgi:hypothetical protein